MIITHADDQYGALCGETMPDSSGYVATTAATDDVDCEHCRRALGEPSALLPLP